MSEAEMAATIEEIRGDEEYEQRWQEIWSHCNPALGDQ